MTNVHPMFVSIIRAYGVAPTEDEEEERCKGCGVTREQDKHMETPCPFADCPFATALMKVGTQPKKRADDEVLPKETP